MTQTKSIVLILSFTTLIFQGSLSLYAQQLDGSRFGSFIGKVVAAWNNDGRTMTLMEPFAYLDPKGRRWNAPVGSQVDGASIPQFAWSFIGGPFEEKYRNASVIHDVACIERRYDWQDVHLAFYTGMLAAGVSQIKAKVMYAAVFHFGPRWPRTVTVKDVPIGAASSWAKDIASHSRKGENSEVNIQPGPTRPQPCATCAFPLPDLPPDTAEIRVKFIPRNPTLSQGDFELLMRSIEKEDLALGAIEDFKIKNQ